MKMNVKKGLLVLAGALVMVGAGMLTSCEKGYGKITDKKLAIGEYSAIVVTNGVDIEMTEAIKEPMLSADELVLDKVEVKVEDGTLFIELKDMVYTTKIKELKVQLPLNPQLKKISATGGMYVKVEGDIALNELVLCGESSADIHRTSNLQQVKMSGNSRADISGEADILTIDLTNGSELYAKDLHAGEVVGTMSGISMIETTICSRIAIQASGQSTINYYVSGPDCAGENACELTGGSVINKRD